MVIWPEPFMGGAMMRGKVSSWAGSTVGPLVSLETAVVSVEAGSSGDFAVSALSSEASISANAESLGSIEAGRWPRRMIT